MAPCVRVIVVVIVMGVRAASQGVSSRDEYRVDGETQLLPGEVGRYELDLRQHASPRYVLLASRLVRPGTIYRALAVLLAPEGPRPPDPTSQQPISVRASVSRDGVELASARKEMVSGDAQMLMMKIPSTSVPGEYRLRVEGDLPGSLGGSAFVNETRLEFAHRFLTVLIQTSRPMYSFSQWVRFRIVMLRTDLKPFDDPIDVYVLDSDGYIMRRWPSQSSNNGVVSLKFKTPFIGKGGWWRIRVNVRGQIEEKFIKMTKYFIPQWEVFVWTPTYFVLSDAAVAGEFSAGYTNDKSIRGNATLELYVRSGSPVTELDRQYKFVAAQYMPQVYGGSAFSFPMSLLAGKVSRLDGAEVKVVVRVNDYWYNETMVGFCNSKLINSSMSVAFLGGAPQMYKPGMPFRGQVLVTYHDSAPLASSQLRASSLTIRSSDGAQIQIPSERDQHAQSAYRNGSLWRQLGGDEAEREARRDDPLLWRGLRGQKSYIEMMRELYLSNQRWNEYRESGLHRFELDMPPRGSAVELTATFVAEDGTAATAALRLEPFYSEEKNIISVETSNQRTDVGGYAVFHVRSNFPMMHFFVVVISKNLVIHGDRVPVTDTSGGSVTTFSLPVSAEMAPSFRLMVFHVTTAGGELITDSVQVPVEGINRGTTKLVLNQHKDHSKNTVELSTWSTPGATFCTASSRAYLFSVQGGNDLTRASVLANLHSFENSTRRVHQALWRWRDGSRPHRSEYFVTPDYGVDTNSSFELAQLVVFTDARVQRLPNSECVEGERRCLTRGCFNATKACDGLNDCADGSDETGCDTVQSGEEAERRFRLRRRSHFKDLFDPGDGDWAWLLRNIGYLGVEQHILGVPETNDDWYITGFSISQKDGFGLIEQPLPYTSNRPFYMTMEVASQIRRGESLSARLLLVNNQNIEVLALVVLPHSDQYQFIHVEKDGVISHRNARTSSGDHQHLLPIEPEASIEVTIPIKPLVELGELDITVKCITQFGLDVESATVSVLAEGVPIGKHTSFLLDLKNRAVDHKFLNIFTEQSPEVPYATWRRFVYGSPQGTVTVSGDVIGPIFPSGFMTTNNVFGKPIKSLDGNIFNLAYNGWSLHYLRLTNQLSRRRVRAVLEKMNVQFIVIMKRYRRGPFLFFDGGMPSVWGTAWAARQLEYSQFQDWENFLYVEPRILSESAAWLCQYQNPDGSFNETEWYERDPLDQKMRSRVSDSVFSAEKRRRVPLTAHVLITLHAVQEKLQGQAKANVSTAKILATQYLERSVNTLTDGFEIAITAYALTLANSADRELAFGRLQRARREVDSMYYWSPEPIQGLPVSRDVNQRPYLEAKNEQKWDARAVEGTAYALLVYLLKDGVGIDQEKMVQWLNSMRMYNGAWVSTVDTIVAMQALTEYAFRARLRDITDLTVTLDTSGLRSFNKVVHVGNTTAGTAVTVPLPHLWGHVNVVGSGAGQAVVQLDLSFGIDRENLKDTPPVKSFDLNIRENALQAARNKSIIDVEVCYRWVNTNESAVSGAVILDVEMPSGYRIDQQVANADVRRLKRNQSLSVMNAKVAPDRVLWFLDRVYSNYTQCFQYSLFRRYLVANYTAYRSARMYEYFAPERFEMQILNSTELNVIDICQVCGSYQCPYCPWYSGAPGGGGAILWVLAAVVGTLPRFVFA